MSEEFKEVKPEIRPDLSIILPDGRSIDVEIKLEKGSEPVEILKEMAEISKDNVIELDDGGSSETE